VSAEARYFRVGVFVFAGALAITSCVVVLGGNTLFQQTFEFETYFDGSVQGLEVGSPVRLRGVDLGRVTKIEFVENFYDMSELSLADRRKYRNYVYVRMEQVVNPSEESTDAAELAYMIESGLRLRLTTAGLTGTSFLEGDYLDPTQFPALEVPWQPKTTYVPSARSTFDQLTSGVERMMARLEELDFEGLMNDVRQLVQTTGERVDSLDVGKLQEEAVLLMQDLRKSSEDLRTIANQSKVPELVARATSAADEINAAVVRVQRMMDGGRYDLEGALENLRVASENLRDLTETLRAQPSLLLRSAAPERTNQLEITP